MVWLGYEQWETLVSLATPPFLSVELYSVRRHPNSGPIRLVAPSWGTQRFLYYHMLLSADLRISQDSYAQAQIVFAAKAYAR